MSKFLEETKEQVNVLSEELALHLKLVFKVTVI